MPRLILGTHNRKKAGELIELLEPLGLELATLADVPGAIEVEEDGATFRENAAKKATEQARHLGAWVLAEDSGLAVDALKGAPGVYSARYSGPQATDESNNQKLLAELGDLPPQRRGCHYVCCMVLSDSHGEVQAESHGRCHGRIIFAGRGTHGFGYDPLFEIPEYHRTFGELGPAVKHMLSHRGAAARKLLPQLRQLLQQGAFS